jgi:energy-coupling factor transporter ATP-binding protein EcfA2
MTTDIPPSTPALRVRSLEYRYPDGRAALRGIDLDIEPGQTVAVVGPNGAGKSTLLLHLNGLLPGRSGRGGGGGLHAHGFPAADGGRAGKSEPNIWIGGLPVTPRNAVEVRRRVGLVFQDPDDQLFCATVIEDVAFGPLNLGKDRAEARRIAEDALARVDLLEVAQRMPHHLSFGERKRVCLAGVLACGPSVLVLDEPTANLDPRGRRRFIQLIRDLGTTTIIATHDLEMVLEVCPRSVVLDRGLIVADGPSREVLADAALLEAHDLEVPISLARDRGGSAIEV